MTLTNPYSICLFSWRPYEIYDNNPATHLRSASCAAGGKLLFGTAYIKRLDLDDGELATLIAHEVAHAVAEHQREELSMVYYLNSGSFPISVATAMARFDSDLSLQIRLSTLLRIQESEADQLGMIIAHNAGWPASSMVSFYPKNRLD